MNVRTLNDCAKTWLCASPVLNRPSRYVTPGVGSADHMHEIVVGLARVQLIVIAVGIGPWTGAVVVVGAIVVVEVKLVVLVVVVADVVVVAGLVVVAVDADVVEVAAGGGAVVVTGLAVVVAAVVVDGLNTVVGGGAAVVGAPLVTAVAARVVDVAMRETVVVGIALTGVVTIGPMGVDVDATTVAAVFAGFVGGTVSWNGTSKTRSSPAGGMTVAAIGIGGAVNAIVVAVVVSDSSVVVVVVDGSSALRIPGTAPDVIAATAATAPTATVPARTARRPLIERRTAG